MTRRAKHRQPPQPLRLLAPLLPLALLAATGSASVPAAERKGASVAQETTTIPPAPKRVDVPIDPKLRAAAVAELEAGLKSPNVMARVHAVEAIKDGLRNDGADLIIARLADPANEVKFAALMAAGELRLEGARQPALALVNDNSPSLRIASRFALHRLGDTRFSHDLEKTAHSTDPLVRGQTVFALGLLGEPSAVVVLKPLQNDPSVSVRMQVAEALWRLGDRDGFVSLVAAGMSMYPADQMMAFPALVAPHDPRVAEHVRVGLVADDLGVCLCAARAMGEIGSDEGYGLALRGAKSKSPMLRMLAALAMGSIGRTDAQPALAILLNDRSDDLNSPAVRLAAAAAVLRLAPSKPAVE